MNSKLVLLIGGVLASLVVFLCIKNETAEVKHLKVIKKPIAKLPIKEITLKESKFNYTYSNNIIDGIFSITDQEYVESNINSYCKDINCTKKIKYKGNIKNSSWKKLLFDSMLFFQKYSIADSKIIANGNSISIEGTLNSEEQYHEINLIINDYNNTNISIINNIKFIPTALPPVTIVKELQDDIDKILEENPIFFKHNSDILTTKSRETLKKIIKYLNKLNTNSTIQIDGHTDAIGRKSYNLLLSLKRAKSVKRFLEDNAVEDLLLIKTKGFGSAHPKLDNPNDPKNRRVEITIQKANND